MSRATKRLIVALDVPTVEEAYSLIERIGDGAGVYKLGPWLTLAHGFERLIDGLVGAGKEVFLDTKGFDIPETIHAGIAAAAARGVGFITIHGNEEMTEAAIAAAVSAKGDHLKIFAVTVLTSIDRSDLKAAGRDMPVADLALLRAQRALRLGCDGVIASGHEARSIRAMAGERPFLVATPGIRPADARDDDQKRITTPTDAIVAGADYLVIGRPIVRAADPGAAAHRIAAEMQAAFDRRPT